MFRVRVLALSLTLATGCGFLDAAGTPLIEAHRGGPGRWPQNSVTALLGSLEAGVGGIEFDVVLTSDLHPVISHDPWVNETLCTRVNGEPLTERFFIQDLTLEQFTEGFVCGGLPDPDFPDAELVAEPPMIFQTLLDVLPSYPEVLVHIDVKYEPGMTPAPEEMATQILDRWKAANLPNRWYTSANLPEATRALKQYGTSIDLVVPTSLAWPRFPPDGNDVAIALSSEFSTLLGLKELEDLAEEGEADGLAIPYQVIERRAAESARRRGLQIQVWTVNSDALLKQYCRWPIDGIITDFPERAPCR